MDSNWIKIMTNIFDNNKIKYIRTLPDGNNIALFWIMLLVKAGQCNENGYVLVTQNIAYSEELLAEEFKFSVTLVKAALKLFEQLQMISFENSVIYIENWAKYQNVEGLEKIKENNRIRQARYRAKKKLMLQSNVTDNVTNNTDVTSNVTQSNALEKEEEKEIDIDIDKDINTKVFIEKWNSLGLNKLINIKNKRLKSLKARVKEYGVDKVLLAIDNIKQSDFLQGNNERGWVVDFDWFLKPNNFIKVLENKYKNNKKTVSSSIIKFNNFEPRSYDYDSLEKKLLGWEE